MHWRLLATVFSTVFLAELGDKTQLATFLYASDASNPKLVVFAGAALALVAGTVVGVAGGSAVSRFANPRMLTTLAGVAFVAIGIAMIVREWWLSG